MLSEWLKKEINELMVFRNNIAARIQSLIEYLSQQKDLAKTWEALDFEEAAEKEKWKGRSEGSYC